MNRIFQVTFAKPQYWVLDALDECCPPQSLAAVMRLLGRIDSAVPVRVFMTSCPSDPAEALLNRERIIRAELSLRPGQEASLADIEAYVRERVLPDVADDLHFHCNPLAKEDQNEEDSVIEIVRKANGNFFVGNVGS